MIDGVSGGFGQLQASYSGTKAAAPPPPPPPASKPIGVFGNLPGQAGGGIGDLQSVAPSSLARGQIVDIAA